MTHNDLWGSVTEDDDDEWVDLLTKKADAYIYKRLIFDTPKCRQNNKLFFSYNPYLICSDTQNDLFDDLYGPSPEYTGKPEGGVTKLKKLLEILQPFVTFLNRIHGDVMENETTTHQMFQKSIFYEVCFYYCMHKTSEDLLTTMILGCNDTYLGFPIASIDRMRQKYTGKQYVSIIPRGLGKTRCIKLSVAVALITWRNCEILSMAHTRSLICTTKDDIETTLLTKFSPIVYGYEMRKHEDSLILHFKDGSSSRLKYASACRPSSLRGNDPDIGFLDEALCVPEESLGVIIAMIQRDHTKIGMLSSPIASKKHALVNLVVNMKSKCSTINLYRLCFFCMNGLHVQYSVSHTGCYRKLFAPRYITYDEANKNFEGVITRSEASYENELGVIRPEDVAHGRYDAENDDSTRAVFTKEFINHIRNPLTHVRIQDLFYDEEYACYWIYMDPAFHPSEQSAIAITCVRFVRGNQAVLCFADRKLLNHGDLGRVSDIIEEMYVQCVTTLVEMSPVKCYFFVAIERNSNPDAVRSYYNTWVNLHSKGVVTKHQCDFFYYVDVYSGRNLSYGYNLGVRKKHIFSTMVSFLNNRHNTHFKIASTVEHGVFTQNTCTIEHLVEEIKNFHYKDRKYTGKINKVSTDDMTTCLVMSLYHGIAYRLTADKRISNLHTEQITHCTPPWIGTNCKCPL